MSQATPPTERASTSLEVRLDGGAIAIGPLRVHLHRTLRIPDDGNHYPLPPSLGTFPLRRVDDHLGTVPEGWHRHGGVFFPMYQREAMWMSFHSAEPMAVKVATGKVNAVSGTPWRDGLHRNIDDDVPEYLVVPDQPWLDGFNAGDGIIRQFVAMPLGLGYTVEGQLTGAETHGGIQLQAFAARPGRITASEGLFSGTVGAPPGPGDVVLACAAAPLAAMASPGAEMGLAAGGRMTQKIYPDPHGFDTWDPNRSGRIFVHIVNSLMYREITGEPAPESPVSARTYTEHGLPWFRLYDEARGTAAESDALSGIRSVREMDEAHGFGPQQDDGTIDAVATPPPSPGGVRDGDW
jgi:hypothetical protein